MMTTRIRMVLIMVVMIIMVVMMVVMMMKPTENRAVGGLLKIIIESSGSSVRRG